MSPEANIERNKSSSSATRLLLAGRGTPGYYYADAYPNGDREIGVNCEDYLMERQ